MASFKHHPQAVVVLATILALMCCPGAGAVPFAGGTGEPNDPYQIATAEQLVATGRDPNLFWSHFILVNDIDLDPNLSGGCVFHGAVVGPDIADANFYGSFDGQGFKVLNLTIDAPEGWAESLALFSQIGETGRVCNLGVENAVIRGGPDSRNVAALVGTNWGCVVGCRVSGSVSGGEGVGGLCGENRYFLRSCYSTASVSGDSRVGGLVGRSIPSTPVPSRSGGTVGGISNCYSSGVVSARELAGGLIGYGGENGKPCAVVASFWDIEISGLKTSAAGIGLATSQMMTDTIFAAYLWDRDPNWVMADGEDYPRLAWEKTGGQPIEGDLSGCFEGAGTALDPYRIATAEQFALIGLLPGLLDKHFVLEADLDLGQVSLCPIGQGTGGVSSYNGFFHGNGHVLRSSSGEPLDLHGVGLFGAIGPQGRVSNLGLEGIFVTGAPGSSAVGTLAGTNAGVITSCYATGVVEAQQSGSAGGLVGFNSGRIAYSYAVVAVIRSPLPGDLVGSQGPSGLILECYANGTAFGAVSCGALVGTNEGVVANSYFQKAGDASFASAQGFPLSFSDMMTRKESFVGWDFAGSASDGPADRWYMPAWGGPILSWQADLQGLRPIPDVGNLPLEWARAEIELAGFVVGQVLHDYHPTIPKDWTILTSPLGLASVGSTIDVVLSQGNYSMPVTYYGTYSGPLLVRIETPGQVECLAGVIGGDSNFLLSRDIDMAGWEMPLFLRPTNAVFTGTFLGNGHRISNLKLFRNGGFFNQIGAEGLVHGLRLEGVLAGGLGQESLGALASENEGAVLDCCVTGVVEGSRTTKNLGGLVGKNNGIISECFAAAAIRGPSDTSEAGGHAEVLPACGGLVGLGYGGIADCYTAGQVSGIGYVGGLVGDNHASIARCHAVVHTTGQTPGSTGGLVGRNGIMPPGRTGGPFPFPVTDCYFLSPASGGGPDNGFGTALTAAQMSRQASFVGWDFMGVWTICEGRDYPRLRWEGVECEPQ